MEDVLVKEVVQHLSCTNEIAFALLHYYGWNLQMVLLEASQVCDQRVDGSADSLLVNKSIQNGFIGNDTLSSFPDVVLENDTFLKNVEQDCLEKSMKRSLEESKHLNWWIKFIGAAHKLFPLSTIGDGNCLLHALSLGMFGVTDRLVILRNALYKYCNNDPTMMAIERRWRLSLACNNSRINLILSEQEWQDEWASVTSAPTLERIKSPDLRYIGLEDIHIFILAHMIKRPIIVLAQDFIKNSKNENIAPINFAGIYIPFECPVEQLSKCPIILGYHGGHFAPLVYMDTYVNQIEMLTYLLPTIDYNGGLLPLKFFMDPGLTFGSTSVVPENILDIDKNEYSKIIRKYFNITNFEGAVPDDDKFLNLGEDKRMKSINHIQTLNNIRKSVLKLKKDKETAVHPSLCNADLIEVVVKNPENFKQILISYSDLASTKQDVTSSKQSFNCSDYLNRPIENVNYEREGGFGIGKSRFYREADSATYNAISKIPKSSMPRDKTLYLAKSTFFNDTGKSFDPENDNKIKKISSVIKSTTEECKKISKMDYIPFVDENCDLNGFGLPKLCFDDIVLPYSAIKTMDFSDRRPVDEIADDIANAVSPKLNFISFC